MTQLHPNPFQTHASGSAFPSREGAAHPPAPLPEDHSAMAQVRALLADENALDPCYYLNTSPSQREELARASAQTMQAEVVLLRSAMKRFHLAVHQGEEAGTVSRLAEELKLLGLTCSRLANVLRLNMALQTAADARAHQDLMKTFMDAVSTWDEEDTHNG